MITEPEKQPKFELYEEFGSIEISADLFGLHIHENDGNGQAEVWANAEEAEQMIRFIQFWMPRIKEARPPKCPACYAKHEHTPGEDPHDGEMKPDEPGNAFRWHCVFCGNKYCSGPFGKDLREVKSYPVSPYLIDGDGFDPFLDSDELP